MEISQQMQVRFPKPESWDIAIHIPAEEYAQLSAEMMQKGQRILYGDAQVAAPRFLMQIKIHGINFLPKP